MKRLSFIIFFIGLTTTTLFGQRPRPLTKSDSIQIELKLNKSIQQLKHESQGSEYLDELSTLFKLDTFRIEERQKLKLEIDYSTAGMVSSAFDAMDEYDVLLNKYYSLLLKKLNEEGKTALRESQRNWIQFRDSELELNQLLTDEYYSGGGTIQRVIYASRALETTKHRVIELYFYLNRGYQ